jgi:IclR family transcriptional regulator, acetate operon repressor
LPAGNSHHIGQRFNICYLSSDETRKSAKYECHARLETRHMDKQSTKVARRAPEAIDEFGPRSLLRTLRILETIASQPETTTLARLNEELQTPKSSLLGLLRALTRNGYLTYDGNNYALGPAAHRLAIRIVAATHLNQVARPAMRDLVDSTSETVLLAVLDSELRQLIYIDKIESPNSIRFIVPVGTVRPLYSTAPGKLLLAFQPAQWIENYLSSTKLESFTEATQTNRSRLKQLLAQIRRDAVSTSLGEMSPDVSGFSAGIFNHEGILVATLSLGAPLERGRVNLKRYLAATRASAAKISHDLGWIGAWPPMSNKGDKTGK